MTIIALSVHRLVTSWSATQLGQREVTLLGSGDAALVDLRLSLTTVLGRGSQRPNNMSS
ncbi:MAG: hypothetical protein M3083_13615 [Actinomycetota bacterium]|nr:hypothetical protein [Actinomycetota bacterium]